MVDDFCPALRPILLGEAVIFNCLHILLLPQENVDSPLQIFDHCQNSRVTVHRYQ